MIQISIHSFAYGKNEPLIKDLRLELDSSKAYMLSGENGCGKSTLINILSGRQQLNSQQKEGFGFDYKGIAIAPGEVASELFFLPQNPLTEMLGLCGRQDLEIWQMALPKVDMDTLLYSSAVAELLDLPYPKLSSGQLRQLSQLMLPHLMERYWFLDEAFAGLDKPAAERLVNLLNSKLATGTGYLLVSHEEWLAEALGASLIKMENRTCIHLPE